MVRHRAVAVLMASVALVLLAAGWVLLADHGTALAKTSARDGRRGEGSAGAATTGSIPAGAPREPEEIAVDADGEGSAPAEDGPAATQAADAPPIRRFAGQVADVDGRPLPGARVVLVPGHATYHRLGHARLWYARQVVEDGLRDSLVSALTGPDGRFALEGPHATTCPCQPEAWTGDSWATEPGLIVMLPGHALFPHVCAGYRDGDYDAGLLPLEPGGSLAGRVVDGGGQPQPGVDVCARLDDVEPARIPATAYRNDDDLLEIFLRQTTGADGRFQIDQLWRGRVTLELTGDAIESLRVWNQRIEPGRVLDVGDLVITLTDPIAGVVNDDAGQPVPGADVFLLEGDSEGDLDLGDSVLERIVEADAEPLARRAITDGRGRFRFGGLDDDSDNYIVCARAEGREPAATGGITAGRQDLVLTLATPTSLPLAVVDASSLSPLPDATVRATRRVVRHRSDAQDPPVVVQPAPAGDVDGATHLLSGLGRNATDLIVSAPGHGTVALRLPPTSAIETRPFIVTLPGAQLVTGRVLSTAGTPAAGALVRAQPRRAGPSSPWGSYSPEAACDPQGQFTLDALPPGDWVLTAEAQGYCAADQVAITTPLRGPLDLWLRPGTRITGTVLDVDGCPVRGGTVNLKALSLPEFDGRSTDTEPTGAFSFDGLPEGEWLVTCGVSATARTTLGAEASVVLRRQRPAVVSGRLSSGGTPPSGMVRVLRFDSDVPDRPVSHPGFAARATASGAYRLELHEPGRYALVGVVGSAASLVVRLEVRPGDVRVQDLAVMSTPLEARVVDAVSKEPLSGAWATLVDDAGQSLVSAPTDADGKVTFAGVPPGRYALRGWAQWHASGLLDPVTVGEAGGGDAGTLVMPPVGELRLRLVDDAGHPFRGEALVLRLDGPTGAVLDTDTVWGPDGGLGMLPPGRCTVVAIDPRWHDAGDDAAFRPLAVEVEIQVAAVIEQELRILGM